MTVKQGHDYYGALMIRSRLSFADHMAIAAGGVVGATTRWALGRRFETASDESGWFQYAPNTTVVPGVDNDLIAGRWGTVIANIVGCLLLGVVTTLLARTARPNTARPSKRRWLLALGTGFCGALTTFAAFAVESTQLLRLASATKREIWIRGPDPSWGVALTYLTVSLVGGGLAFATGRSAALRVAKP